MAIHDLVVTSLRTQFDAEVIIAAVGTAVIGMAPCAVPDCLRGTHMMALCHAHYHRWNRAGRPDATAWVASADPGILRHRPLVGCAVPGCQRGQAAHRLCARHIAAYRRDGQPELAQWLLGEHDLPHDVSDCALPDCDLIAESDLRPLCRQHTSRWQAAGKPAIDQFLTDCLVQSVDAFDLRELAAPLRREVQYGIQCRVDDGRIKTTPLRLRPLLRYLTAAGCQSLRERTVEQWRTELTAAPGLGFVNMPLSFIRFTLDCLEDLQIGVGWESEYPRDVWRLRRLGYRDGSLAHLRFDTIGPPWLRDLAKRWLRWRLSTGLSITQAGKDAGGLRSFARFLSDIAAPASPAALDRELIERYLAWLSITRPARETRRCDIGALAGFLRAVQQHRWADDLSPTATIFAEDYPRQVEPPARALSGYIMSQLEAAANLSRFEEPRFRLLTEILQRAGLRVGDARRLPVHCVIRDEHGAAYLAYRNHKMRRDAAVPIDDDLTAAIAIQQDAVLARWPDGDVLFPMIYANPDGHRPISRATYASQLQKWLLSCDVRDEAGRPARPTPHQFRHTYATVLMNNDVPQYVVQKLLDHDSATMTARYGRLSQQTIRRHWEAARKAGISGEVTVDTSGPLADAAWLKNSLSRAKMALPNGYCTLPMQQTCEYANACLSCPMFLTTAEFLPEHRRQLAETRQMLGHAERHDQQRVLQMNRTVERNLLTIIKTLEQPTCCSGGGATKGCACASREGHDDAR